MKLNSTRKERTNSTSEREWEKNHNLRLDLRLLYYYHLLSTHLLILSLRWRPKLLVIYRAAGEGCGTGRLPTLETQQVSADTE